MLRHVPIALLTVLLAAPVRAEEPDPKPINDKIKEVAGTAEFLRSVPKHFAILQGLDRSRGRVKLLIEGESQPREIGDRDQHGTRGRERGLTMDENDHPKGALLCMLVYLFLLAALWSHVYVRLWGVGR